MKNRQNMPHTRHMSREIRQLDKAGENFGYKIGYMLTMVIFSAIIIIFRLTGRLIVWIYHLIKVLIIKLKSTIKKS